MVRWPIRWAQWCPGSFLGPYGQRCRPGCRAGRAETEAAPVPHKKGNILRVHTCESTSNQPSTSIGQTHRIRGHNIQSLPKSRREFQRRQNLRFDWGFFLCCCFLTMFKRRPSKNLSNCGDVSDCTWTLWNQVPDNLDFRFIICILLIAKKHKNPV